MAKELDIFSRPGRDSFALGARARKSIAAYIDSLQAQGWPLSEYTRVLDDALGFESHWFEYVPSTYDAANPVPLVISFHAGHYYAAAQVFDTTWCEIAEREGFIVVFPEAHEKGCFSSCSEKGELDFDGVDYLIVDALVADLEDRFSIDASRVYVQGFSRGAMFAMEFALRAGSKVTAIANTCGPAHPAIFDALEHDESFKVSPTPIIQTRCLYDATSPFRGIGPHELADRNRHFWMQANGCVGIPAISVTSRELTACYPGSKADYIYRETTIHNHLEPISAAEDAWSLFKTVRRADDGSVVRIEPLKDFSPDAGAIAVGDMSSKALVNNELVEVGSQVRQYREVNVRKRGGFQDPVRNEAVQTGVDGVDMNVYYYAPIEFIARVFGLEAAQDGDTAQITGPQGQQIRFAKGSPAAVIDNRVRDMGQTARIVDGEFCIPIDWFAEYVMGKCTAQADGVLYIANHQVVMTTGFASIIREIIGWGA